MSSGFISGGVHTFDYLVILLYLLLMVYIGYYFKGKIINSDDFYIAGRSLPSLVIMATVCASIIGGGALIGRSGVTYSQGAVALILGLPYVIGMYVFSAVSGRIREVGEKNNISSIPDLMQFRFGPGLKYLTSLLIAYTMMATVGTQVTATATVFKTIGAGFGITYEMGALIAVVVFVSYTVFSGLFGVVYTDVAQFVVLIAFVYIALPIIALVKMRGGAAFVAKVPPQMWSMKPSAEIIGWIFTNLVFTMAGAEMWQRAFAARSGKEAKKGMYLGTTIFFISVFIVTFMGLAAYVLIPNLKQLYGSADAAVVAMIIHYLPVGITGLALAGVLAALMSSADTYLLISVQTVIRDIWKGFNPSMSGSDS